MYVPRLIAARIQNVRAVCTVVVLRSEDEGNRSSHKKKLSKLTITSLLVSLLVSITITTLVDVSISNIVIVIR